MVAIILVVLGAALLVLALLGYVSAVLGIVIGAILILAGFYAYGGLNNRGGPPL